MIIDSTKNYLSEVFDFLPSHVLLDKGMTGCGGTTLELTCKRNSLVLVPTVNLVLNKTSDGMLGVTAKTKDSEITEYINSDIHYNNIIVRKKVTKNLLVKYSVSRFHFLREIPYNCDPDVENISHCPGV